MLKPTDIRVGNLIQYDHDERRQPPVCMQRGWVKEIHTDGVVLTNGEKRKWERTEGLPIDEELLVKFGFESYDVPNGTKNFSKSPITLFFIDGEFIFDQLITANEIEIKFIHKLQNLYYDLTDRQELEITLPEPPPIHPQQ